MSYQTIHDLADLSDAVCAVSDPTDRASSLVQQAAEALVTLLRGGVVATTEDVFRLVPEGRLDPDKIATVIEKAIEVSGHLPPFEVDPTTDAEFIAAAVVEWICGGVSRKETD